MSFALACARPSLDDEDAGDDMPRDDASQPGADVGMDAEPAPTGDGGGEPPGPGSSDASVADAARDASASDAGRRDAASSDAGSGCSDVDGDSVCDAKDNCPNTPNADQADSNGDGVGNACQAAGGSCDNVQLDTGAFADGATLLSATVNGSMGVAQVKAGEQVTGTLTLEFASCGLFTVYNLFMGAETELPFCTGAGCSGTNVKLQPIQFKFTAPQTAGLYYVLAGITQASPNYCAAGGLLPAAGATGTKKVAAVCVTQ